MLEEILERGMEQGLVADAAFAESLEQAKAFWRLREMFGEVQRYAGGSIKHDVSVPVAAVPAFIAEADAAVAALFPAPGRCRSAISATATSIITSTSRSAPTPRPISSAGTR